MNYDRLDQIVLEAYRGDYANCGVLSTGERLYVALASGRMWELCPQDSIAYAVGRVGPSAMSHMTDMFARFYQPARVCDGIVRFRQHHGDAGVEPRRDSICNSCGTVDGAVTPRGQCGVLK